MWHCLVLFEDDVHIVDMLAEAFLGPLLGRLKAFNGHFDTQSDAFFTLP